METPDPFIAAVVQTSPVFFNKAQTVEKIQSLIGEAARQKASLILFPEVIIPGYPRGLIFGTTVGSRSDEGREMFLRYWENSIVAPGPETDLISRSAKPSQIITSTGGSCIISPFGKPLAGPLYDQEGILIAEIDHREIIKAKMDFDVIGHYARPDVFELKVKGINS